MSFKSNSSKQKSKNNQFKKVINAKKLSEGEEPVKHIFMVFPIFQKVMIHFFFFVSLCAKVSKSRMQFHERFICWSSEE
jgi:hypothetical protein